MTAEPLIVIGIGQDGPGGLGSEAHAYLARAHILAGAKRHLAFFPDFKGAKIVLEGPPASWVRKLKAREEGRRTVVLATGDPLFFGIGRLLLDVFAREELLFVPHVSSVSLAFARLKETCNDACVVSLHGRPLEMLLPALERGESKIAIFTDAKNHPAAIARLLCERGLGQHYVLWVCENLGGDQERITRWSPPDPRKEEFASLNVVVLLAEPEALAKDGGTNFAGASGPGLPLLGLPESAIRHRGEPDGLISKREVRLLALCYLKLHPGDVLWDVGAGSGSLSLEGARLSPTLAVFAIEKAPEALVYLQENLNNFRLGNVRLIAGEAPECLEQIPDPDAVFIGGSGGRLLAILDHVMHRLKPGGRLVLVCITLETLSQAWSWLGERRLEAVATSLGLAHSRPLGNLHCLEPDKPIFFLRVEKVIA